MKKFLLLSVLLVFTANNIHPETPKPGTSMGELLFDGPGIIGFGHAILFDVLILSFIFKNLNMARYFKKLENNLDKSNNKDNTKKKPEKSETNITACS